ncbi:MAG TPA: M48 family metalloprotease [Methylomirabilota bacterium]|nr:M48 family metalloprotease [Methylomirabilota bacterium]
MRRSLGLLLVLLATGACATVPERAYYPSPSDPETRVLAEALWRAARAASEDPRHYSFAMIRGGDVSAYTVEDATFYFTQGLARQPARVVDALVAHEVAHELLGHHGERRALSLSLGAGFTVLGIAFPGAGLLDLVANPLIVRAFTRDQELAADARAIEILRDMGYETPRRVLAEALRAAAQVNGPPRGGWLATEPKLKDRLGKLEPLEPEKQAAK